MKYAVTHNQTLVEHEYIVYGRNSITSVSQAFMVYRGNGRWSLDLAEAKRYPTDTKARDAMESRPCQSLVNKGMVADVSYLAVEKNECIQLSSFSEVVSEDMTFT
jgi:hypothetical protein